MIKKFDCVEMKHRGAEKIRREIRGLTRQEEIKYWRDKNKALRNEAKKKAKSA